MLWFLFSDNEDWPIPYWFIYIIKSLHPTNLAVGAQLCKHDRWHSISTGQVWYFGQASSTCCIGKVLSGWVWEKALCPPQKDDYFCKTDIPLQSSSFCGWYDLHQCVAKERAFPVQLDHSDIWGRYMGTCLGANTWWSPKEQVRRSVFLSMLKSFGTIYLYVIFISYICQLFSRQDFGLLIFQWSVQAKWDSCGPPCVPGNEKIQC